MCKRKVESKERKTKEVKSIFDGLASSSLHLQCTIGIGLARILVMQWLIDPAILWVVVKEFFQFGLGKSEYHNFLQAWLWGWNRVGVKALVLEQSGALRTEGTSLTLFPNAWRALNALGVADEIRGSFVNLTGYWTLLAISEDYLLCHLGPKQRACANGARKAFGKCPHLHHPSK